MDTRRCYCCGGFFVLRKLFIPSLKLFERLLIQGFVLVETEEEMYGIGGEQIPSSPLSSLSAPSMSSFCKEDTTAPSALEEPLPKHSTEEDSEEETIILPNLPRPSSPATFLHTPISPIHGSGGTFRKLFLLPFGIQIHVQMAGAGSFETQVESKRKSRSGLSCADCGSLVMLKL